MEVNCVSCAVGNGFPLYRTCTRLAQTNQLYDEALMSTWGTTTIPYSSQLQIGHTVKHEGKDCIIWGVETNLDSDTSEIWFVT